MHGRWYSELPLAPLGRLRFTNSSIFMGWFDILTFWLVPALYPAPAVWEIIKFYFFISYWGLNPLWMLTELFEIPCVSYLSLRYIKCLEIGWVILAWSLIKELVYPLSKLAVMLYFLLIWLLVKQRFSFPIFLLEQFYFIFSSFFSKIFLRLILVPAFVFGLFDW